MNCPKCGTKYVCPCNACKGKSWKWHKDDTEECLNCGLRKHVDWWFQLELDINK